MEECSASNQEILTDGIFFLFGHIQFASRTVTHTHALTQRSQFAVVLLFLPDIQERLAVLEF